MKHIIIAMAIGVVLAVVACIIVAQTVTITVM